MQSSQGWQPHKANEKKQKDYGIMQKNSCKAKPNLHLFFCTLRDLFRFLWFFYHPCYELHIKFFILCQYSQVFHQPPLQQFVLVVLQLQALWLQLVVMLFSVLFVGVSFLGLHRQALGFIYCLAPATFGFIVVASVSFVLCPFRALYIFLNKKPHQDWQGFYLTDKKENFMLLLQYSKHYMNHYAKNIVHHLFLENIQLIKSKALCQSQ